MSSQHPITEADLHAYVDGQLTPERQREFEAYLGRRPDEGQRVQQLRAQKRELRALFDPVLDEAVPERLLRAARPRPPWHEQRWVAGLAFALLGGAAGWGLHGALQPQAALQLAQQAPAAAFAQRAAVAHAVYSPEQRRPVEVDAAHEEQLVTWLSKRMGATMKPPRLQAVGYELEGGRLLPGGQGPVAQFMYRNTEPGGGRLTLYVSNEIGALPAATGAPRPASGNAETAFRFAQQGSVKVFYWVDGAFGYAIAADAERATLARVSGEVYSQLGGAATTK
ncbi:MAG: anti-sigma factor [Burkholderiaceae bacterium]|nr:anti-sigma factor [Burkholderiaceae bacterium]